MYDVKGHQCTITRENGPLAATNFHNFIYAEVLLRERCKKISNLTTGPSRETS